MISLISENGILRSGISEWLADTEADKAGMSLKYVQPGSKCFVIESLKSYLLDGSKTWIELQAPTPETPEIDLTGLATEEWVNEQIALILNNPSVDVDSIAELAKVLEEGGADLIAIREAITALEKKLDEYCLLTAFEAYKAEQKEITDSLAQAAETEKTAREGADAELQTAIEVTNANLAKNVEAINKKIQAEIDNNAMVHNMSAQVDAKLMDDIHAVEKSVENEVTRAKAAEEALADSVAANDERITQEIASVKEEFTGYKNDMANVHNMQAQVDAKLMDDIHAVEKEVARVDATLKAAIENEGEGIDSIKELALWVEEHGQDAAAIVKSVEDEKARAIAAEEANAAAIEKEVEDRKAAFNSGIEFTQAVSNDLAQHKLDQAEINQKQSKALEEETKRAQEAELDLKKENNMANAVGSRADDTYKIKRTDKGLEISFSNPEEERLNKIVLDKESIKIEQRKQVLNPPTYPAGGEVSTIINDPEYLFATVDELREDINSGGAKAQKMFNAGVLGSGRVYRECNEVPRPGGTGVKLMLDDSGNGYVDCENGAYDVTYDPNAVKIVRIGDFYLYVVYDENHFPIGLCRFGRPEGVFPEGNANHHADWSFTELGEGIDKDIDTSRQPHSKIPFNGLDKEFVGTKAWGSDAHVFKLVQVKERYIIIYSRRGPAFWQPALNKEGIFCPKITNYEFDIQTSANDANSVTHYVLSEDYYAITVKEDTTNSPSNVLSAYDLFDVLEGRGPLVSNIDQYALPYNSMNLWGGYWPEKDDYRVGTFDPDVESYDYDNYSGVLSARKLNPAGNYNIGKLENFHPLRMQDGSEQKIRVATVKGFKTAMDWPNAAAVIPSDCALRSGTIWFQLIFAHTVSNEFKVFYRVLYDGYVKDKSDVRYPWSPCAEIVTTKQLQEVINKITDLEAVRGEIEQLTKSIEKVSAKADENYQKSVAYTDNVKAGLDLRINEGFAKVSADMAEIKTPLYFGEYTNDEEVVAISDLVKYFRKANRGAIIERIYVHMWIDAFEDNTFALCKEDGTVVSEDITELKAIVYVNNEGIVGTDNNIKVVGLTENATLTDTDALYVRPCVGLTVDVPEFRMNTMTTIGNYEVDNAEDFTKAILNAGAGATVTVNNDITLSSDAAAALVIDKPITIRGDGNTKITTDTNTKLFEVYADLTIEGVNLENTVRGGRCVDTRVDNITVTLKDCTISCLEISAQPITVGGASTNGLNVNIDNCQIDGGTGYGIIVFVPVNMNITNSNVHGYAAIYTKAGSEGSVINVNGSNLSSTGVNDGAHFATVVTEGTNVIVAIDEASTVSCEGELQHLTLEDYLSANTLKVQGTALKTQFEEAGFVTESDNDWYTIKEMPATGFTAPNEFTIRRTSDIGTEYVGMISGSYFPKDATMTFEVIVTDYNTGDGGDFYRITDSFASDGYYEVYVSNTPNAAGTPHPSAVKITMTAGDEVIEKTLPIVLG